MKRTNITYICDICGKECKPVYEIYCGSKNPFITNFIKYTRYNITRPGQSPDVLNEICIECNKEIATCITNLFKKHNKL